MSINLNALRPELEGLAVLVVLAVSNALFNLATSGQQVTLSLAGTVVAAAVVNSLTSYYRTKQAGLPTNQAVPVAPAVTVAQPVEQVAQTPTEGK